MFLQRPILKWCRTSSHKNSLNRAGQSEWFIRKPSPLDITMIEVQDGQSERDHLNRLLPHVWRAYYDLRGRPGSGGQAGDLLMAILTTYADGLLVQVPTCDKCGYAMYHGNQDPIKYECHYCQFLVGMTNFDPLAYGKR